MKLTPNFAPAFLVKTKDGKYAPANKNLVLSLPKPKDPKPAKQ